MRRIIEGILLFAIFFFGIGAQWQFGVVPKKLQEKEINWIDRPAVTTIHAGKVCYIWEVKHEWRKTRQLKVCRWEAWI